MTRVQILLSDEQDRRLEALARPVNLGETYTLLRVTRGYAKAKRFLDRLRHSRKLERVVVSEHLERRAYEILGRFSDIPSVSLIPGDVRVLPQ